MLYSFSGLELNLFRTRYWISFCSHGLTHIDGSDVSMLSMMTFNIRRSIVFVLNFNTFFLLWQCTINSVRLEDSDVCKEIVMSPKETKLRVNNIANKACHPEGSQDHMKCRRTGIIVPIMLAGLSKNITNLYALTCYIQMQTQNSCKLASILGVHDC